ncbi:hypothetical protein AAMO2058_000093100 [Amorphochlora amoebiformis]
MGVRLCLNKKVELDEFSSFLLDDSTLKMVGEFNKTVRNLFIAGTGNDTGVQNMFYAQETFSSHRTPIAKAYLMKNNQKKSSTALPTHLQAAVPTNTSIAVPTNSSTTHGLIRASPTNIPTAVPTNGPASYGNITAPPRYSRPTAEPTTASPLDAPTNLPTNFKTTGLPIASTNVRTAAPTNSPATAVRTNLSTTSEPTNLPTTACPIANHPTTAVPTCVPTQTPIVSPTGGPSQADVLAGTIVQPECNYLHGQRVDKRFAVNLCVFPTLLEPITRVFGQRMAKITGRETRNVKFLKIMRVLCRHDEHIWTISWTNKSLTPTVARKFTKIALSQDGLSVYAVGAAMSDVLVAKFNEADGFESREAVFVCSGFGSNCFGFDIAAGMKYVYIVGSTTNKYSGLLSCSEVKCGYLMALDPISLSRTHTTIIGATMQDGKTAAKSVAVDSTGNAVYVCGESNAGNTRKNNTYLYIYIYIYIYIQSFVFIYVYMYICIASATIRYLS